MKEKQRYSLFCDMIQELDNGCNLISEYDALLHDYNGVVLYQAEAQIIKLVGNSPGISAAECARTLKKTLSACSQLIKKLRAKGWIRQERNELNNRIYNLYLTEEGKEIYKKHRKFEENCYKRTFKLLEIFMEEELKTYIRIQKQLNKAFEMDVEDGREIIRNEKKE